MKTVKMPMTPEQQAMMEYANFISKKQEADIAYIAMMADIDMLDESEEYSNE